MNLPNKLSLTRIGLIPVMVLLLATGDRTLEIVGAAVFGLAAFTDFLDGHIARSQGIVTDLGKLLDPVADKLLTLSAMIMLVAMGLLPAWVVIVVLARELSVDGLRMIAVTKGQVIAAGKLGKIKTISQIVLILFLLLTRWGAVSHLVSGLMCLWVVLITLWSGVDYFVKNWHVLLEDKAMEEEQTKEKEATKK